MQQLVNNDDYIESDTGEREEWMIIADMKLQSDNGNKLSLNCPSDFYAQDRLKYTAQEIGDMPHWINMQKKGNNLRKETTPMRVNIKKFNDAQRIAYNIVQDHFISENKEPLLMMITGLGGSGKSFVIQALSQLLHTKCTVCILWNCSL